MLDLLDAERTFITLGSLTKYKYNTKQIMIWYEKYKSNKKWNLEVKNIASLQTFRCWIGRPYLWLPLEVLKITFHKNGICTIIFMTKKERKKFKSSNLSLFLFISFHFLFFSFVCLHSIIYNNFQVQGGGLLG